MPNHSTLSPVVTLSPTGRSLFPRLTTTMTMKHSTFQDKYSVHKLPPGSSSLNYITVECVAFGFDVIDAVRNHFAKFFVRKVMSIDLQRLAFRAILLPDMCLFSKCFFLLRVNGNRQAASSVARSNASGDVFKLSVAVRVISPFTCLAIALKRVSQRPENLRDFCSSYPVPLRDKLALSVAQARESRFVWCDPKFADGTLSRKPVSRNSTRTATGSVPLPVVRNVVCRVAEAPGATELPVYWLPPCTAPVTHIVRLLSFDCGQHLGAPYEV